MYYNSKIINEIIKTTTLTTNYVIKLSKIIFPEKLNVAIAKIFIIILAFIHLLTNNGLILTKYTNIISIMFDTNGIINEIIPNIKYNGSSEIDLSGIKFNVNLSSISE